MTSVPSTAQPAQPDPDYLRGLVLDSAALAAPNARVGVASSAPGANPVPMPLPLQAGSLRRDEPVTAGVDRGPGPGSEVMNLPTPDDPGVGAWRTARDAVQAVASAPGAPPTLRVLAG